MKKVVLFGDSIRQIGYGNRVCELLGEDYTVWDLHKTVTVDPAEFLSKGRATPFAGWRVKGRAAMTVVGGKCVYEA